MAGPHKEAYGRPRGRNAQPPTWEKNTMTEIVEVVNQVQAGVRSRVARQLGAPCAKSAHERIGAQRTEASDQATAAKT